MLADHIGEPVQLFGRRFGFTGNAVDSGDGLAQAMARRRQLVWLGSLFVAPRQRQRE
jgi:hypothetical protein